MILSWVFLGFLPTSPLTLHSAKYYKISGLGCKRSQVQILSRRPVYLLEIIQTLQISVDLFCGRICAYKCSKMRPKEGIGGGKIGVLPAVLLSQFEAVIRPAIRSLSQSSLVNSNKIHQHVNRGIYGMQARR